MTTPREDAIVELVAAARNLLYIGAVRPFRDAAEDRLGKALDALGAEAETSDRMSPTLGGKYPEPLPATPHPQRRWHRCEYPGCGLWHDSRDEVTR